MNYEKCYHCGAEYGLHQSETLLCPAGGVEETREGHKQEWLANTFLDSKVRKLEDAAPDLLKALEIAMYEVKDWHEYNYNQIESFDNNGTNNERDMQADIANGIYEKLQIIKAAIKKATL